MKSDPAAVPDAKSWFINIFFIRIGGIRINGVRRQTRAILWE
jgi:hypothetical protein